MTAVVHICCRCRPATSSTAAVQPFPYPSVSMKHLGSSRLDPLSSVHLMPSYCPQRPGRVFIYPGKKKLSNQRKEAHADVYSAGWILTSINGVVVRWGAIACSVECLFAPTARIPGTAPGVVVIGTRSGFHLLL